jgi:hypothetical protein
MVVIIGVTSEFITYEDQRITKMRTQRTAKSKHAILTVRTVSTDNAKTSASLQLKKVSLSMRR